MRLFKTFRSRLSATLAAAFGTLSVLSGLLLYLMMQRILDADLDRSLRSMAKIDVGAVISDDSFSRQFLNLRRDAVSKEPALQCKKCHTETLGSRKEERARYFQIISVNGDIICSSHDEGRSMLSPGSFDEVGRSGRTVVRDEKIRGDSVRVISWPMGAENKVEYVVQMGAATSALESTLRHLMVMLGILVAGGLVLTALLSNVLARRALAPVDNIIREVEKIGESNLDQRLQEREGSDEVGRLVLVFNKMLTRLQKSFESQRRFTSDVSHEIRSPLTILRGDIEVTLRRERMAEEYKKVLVSNLEEIKRMSRMSDDLLTLARTDYGDLQLDISMVDLGELLDEIISSHANLMRNRQMNFVFIREKSVVVEADGERLRQVFMNVIENAIIYTPEKGKISVELGTSDGEARIIVKDTGIGIPVEHLPFVFDRFYRVDKARSRNLGGTGLGLSICKEITEAHGGRIEVESKPSEGAKFTIYIPVRKKGGGHEERALI